MAVPANPTLAVFASDKGPGDAERSSIMSQAGTLLARHGVRIVCLAEGALDAIPLVQSARAAGGEVSIIADESFVVPSALGNAAVERIVDPEARLARVAALAQGFVGLPGSLGSVAALYRTWVQAGAGASGKPVILLNRNRAFEAMRGFSADIISHSVPRADRMAVYSESVEDLWNRIAWALNASA